MASFDLLPSELVTMIFLFLDDEKDRLCFCLVSKKCWKLVQPLFYERVALQSNQISSFLRTIISSPYLAELVRDLHLALWNSYIITRKNTKYCAITKEDSKFLGEHLVGTGPYAKTLWVNSIADPRKRCGILIESLLFRLVNLRRIDLEADLEPDFTLLASPGSSMLSPILKTVRLCGENSRKNVEVMHNILAISTVEKASMEFLYNVQGVPEDVDQRWYSLRHLELISCYLKAQDLKVFLRRCCYLQTFCCTFICPIDNLDFRALSRITAGELVEALRSCEQTLRDLHIDTEVLCAPVESLRSFTKLERLRIARRDLVVSSRDYLPYDYGYGLNVDNDDDEGDEEMHDDGSHVYIENSSFLDNLPRSLQLLRIDEADKALLPGLAAISIGAATNLPKLEMLELQSRDQDFETEASKMFKHSNVCIEFVKWQESCRNCVAKNTYSHVG